MLLKQIKAAGSIPPDWWDSVAGMGLLTVFCCLACALVGIGGHYVQGIRNLEDVLPDHDQLQKTEGVFAD